MLRNIEEPEHSNTSVYSKRQKGLADNMYSPRLADASNDIHKNFEQNYIAYCSRLTFILNKRLLLRFPLNNVVVLASGIVSAYKVYLIVSCLAKC